MFTGLIEEIGTINSISKIGNGRKFNVQAKIIMDDLKIDDSVSLNGVCQTVISFDKNSFSVEAVEETLRKTTFENIRIGTKINLERASKIGDRLGGHIVQGHTDCTSNIISIEKESSGILVWVNLPAKFAKYIVDRGSICIDGISLTSAKVENDKFMVSIIPHTWENTVFKFIKPGQEVNLEFDIIGKYVEKLLTGSAFNSSNIKTSSLESYIDQPKY